MTYCKTLKEMINQEIKVKNILVSSISNIMKKKRGKENSLFVFNNYIVNKTDLNSELNFFNFFLN